MNLKAFPFFDSLAEMRSACKHGEKLISPATRFLPFQIAKPHDGQPIDCLNIYTANGQLFRRIMGNNLTYDYHQSPAQDFITYYGDVLPESLPCNTYYLEIAGKYSALFSVANSVTDLLKIEWINSSNLTDSAGKTLVMYQTGFLQRLYLDATVLLPVYAYSETGNENEYKEFLADFKRISKQSQFDTIKLPPYLVDALGALPMHDTVHVGQYREVKEIEVTPTWLDFGKVASVLVKFSEASPVIALGCANNLSLDEYDLSTYTPRGFLCGIIDENPAWQETGVVTCELSNGENTGYTLIQQQDTNPDSPTYEDLRTVKGPQDLTGCPVLVTYYSMEQSEYVKRNNCPAGYTASSVLVKVAAGSFTSTISQLDADNQALQHLNSIKQGEANVYGTCKVTLNLKYAGKLSSGWDTSSQACSSGYAANNHYTESGTFGTGQTVYIDSAGTRKAQKNMYYLDDKNRVIYLDAQSKAQSIKPCIGK